MKIVIIGAGGAGITAATEAKKTNHNAEIVIIDRRENIGYAPCALPYVLGGEIKDFKQIYEFSKEFLEEQGIILKLGRYVTDIIEDKKEVILDNNEKINYDSLILATGSHAFVPPIEGIKDVEFFTLKTMEDANKINDKIRELQGVKKEKIKAVVIGAGFIGAEVAYALSKRGLDVFVLEMAPYVLPVMLDKDFADIVKKELERNDIKVFCSVKINKVEQGKVLAENSEYAFDILILGTGVRANIELAQKIGLNTNKGISVNDEMMTSKQGIFSCGDCIEINHLILNQKVPSQIATTALRTGVIAGYNSATEGPKKNFKGVLNTAVTKIGELTIASTGLTEFFAKKNNINIVKAVLNTETKEEYAPQKEELFIKLISDYNKNIIGAQIIGKEDIVPRIDIIGLAIKNKIKIDELIMMEHAYSPLTSPLREPISILAELCLKKINAKKEQK